MNISVTDLDKGYTQCEELNRLVTEKGEKLISDLSTNINNLKIHWKGSDAKVHIDNLIKLNDNMITLVTGSKQVTSCAGDAMIAVQEVRKANGGSGTVGSALPATAPDAGAIAGPAETTEYYCDPAAKSDYTDLETICTDFNTFKTNFQEDKDALMANWTAGAGHENAVTCFKNFEDNVGTYETWLKDAKENLNTAVTNISKLG